MNEAGKLLEQIEELCISGARAHEESFRLTLEGDSLNAAQATLLGNIGTLFTGLLPGSMPTLLVAGESVGCDEISREDSFLSLSWRLVLAKQGLAALWPAREVEERLFFFTEHGLCLWLEGLNPFDRSSTYDPDFSKPLTIRVRGLKDAFGGPSLWVLPLEAPAPASVVKPFLPDDACVHALVHVASTGPNIRVAPQGWALTWGVLDTPVAQPLLRLGCLVLAACLVNDLKHSDGAITVTIRGTKRFSLPLWNANSDLAWLKLHQRLVDTVAWVYLERPETRLRLLMDRLSLDLNPGDCLLASLQQHLDLALRQAEDSYTFVILDRKDAYYKETRELMKDMKSQSDLYASKTRDLVTSLLRDFLGVLVFIAFSFVGKFDQTRLQEILASHELALFLHFLAGYLLLSFLLQLTAHLRDDALTHREAARWLDVLRNYTSSDEKRSNFMSPIQERRKTLHAAMILSGALYAALILMVWNLPALVCRVLA